MEHLLRTLADGRLREAAEGLEAVRARDPLLAEVMAADVAGRTAAIGLPELRELQTRVEREAADRPLLSAWVLAIIGERAFLDADLGVIPLAAQALADLPDDPFADLALLYVRGRLRRIAAAVYLLAPSAESIADHRRLRDAVVADFLRGGLTAELALTRGLSAALHAIATWEDVLEDLEVVRDARALLGDVEGSVWVPLLDQLLAMVALTAGDFAAADAAITEVERRRDLHPVFAAFADVARAEHALVVGEGDDAAVEGLLAALDRLRRRHLHLLGLYQLQVANLLADFGQVDAARSVGLAGVEWPPPTPVMAVVAALLRLRLAILGGLPTPVEELFPLLERLEHLGHVRRAGALAVRIGRDFDQVGAGAAAQSLRSWGQARLPDVRRQTRWEQLWSEPPPEGPGTVAIRVLVPVLKVAVAGEAVELRDTAAKLLLALVLAHPDPLHVERAVDVLWPDATSEEGRPRLNTVVHRLRTALGPGGAALRRVGDRLALAPDGWDVDLWRYRSLAADDARGRLALLRGMTGNLCHVQFPYDDHFVEARHAFAAEAARTIAAVERTASGPAEPDLVRVRQLLESAG